MVRCLALMECVAVSLFLLISVRTLFFGRENTAYSDFGISKTRTARESLSCRNQFLNGTRTGILTGFCRILSHLVARSIVVHGRQKIQLYI